MIGLYINKLNDTIYIADNNNSTEYFGLHRIFLLYIWYRIL